MTKEIKFENETLYKEEYLQRIRGLRLLDDDFMTKVFDGHPECIELVLQIIMNKDDLKVMDVHTQVFVQNLKNRSVRFDVLAIDSSGNKYDIEIQREGKGAGSKRARYNSSMMDINFLQKGKDFDKLPETYVIFITEKDVLQHGFALYHIDRRIEETNELFGDDQHILYVNGEYRDNSPIGKLMHDFSCTNPDDMNYPTLANRARYFKETEEGREIMCKAFEEVRDEAAKLKSLELITNLMETMNLTLDAAMDALKISEEDRAYIISKIGIE